MQRLKAVWGLKTFLRLGFELGSGSGLGSGGGQYITPVKVLIKAEVQGCVCPPVAWCQGSSSREFGVFKRIQFPISAGLPCVSSGRSNAP